MPEQSCKTALVHRESHTSNLYELPAESGVMIDEILQLRRNLLNPLPSTDMATEGDD